MTGLDGMIRVGMLRAEIRIGSGEFASDSGVFGGGKVTSASGALGFGGRTFWVTGGVGRRAYSGSLGRRVWSFTQVSAGISLGLTNGDVFGRVVAFSPGFVAPGGFRGRPRFFVSHGTADTILPIEQTSRRVVPELKGRGYDVTYREFDGPHAVPPDVATAAFRWLVASWA